MKKGTLLISKGGGFYQVIGKWGKDIVLMPTSETDEQVLIYGAGELDGLITAGRFRILHEMPVEGGQK